MDSNHTDLQWAVTHSASDFCNYKDKPQRKGGGSLSKSSHQWRMDKGRGKMTHKYSGIKSTEVSFTSVLEMNENESNYFSDR